jgi:hypothetical protein
VIGEAGGKVLLPAREINQYLTEFLVDISIPMFIFEQLTLRNTNTKNKGGKKNKAKK